MRKIIDMAFDSLWEIVVFACCIGVAVFCVSSVWHFLFSPVVSLDLAKWQCTSHDTETISPYPARDYERWVCTQWSMK